MIFYKTLCSNSHNTPNFVKHYISYNKGLAIMITEYILTLVIKTPYILP